MNDKNIEEKAKEPKQKKKERPYTWNWLVRQIGYKIIR